MLVFKKNRICDVLYCLLSDLFQEPDANLHLTRVTQKQFVSAFNRLGLEVLVGTEVNFAV